MTRSEIIARVHSKFPNLSYEKCEAVVLRILRAMADALANAGRVEIRGFGSFSVVQRSQRRRRNPRLGTVITVSPSCSPRFKMGGNLRQQVDAAGKAFRAQKKTSAGTSSSRVKQQRTAERERLIEDQAVEA